jgi:glycosyltransferase involved in cell wall biosynthesis
MTSMSSTTASGAATVSVVIPCFNQAHFLAAAVRSARSQHGVILDTIVVDDGSTDETAAIAKSCGADAILRQRNQGLSAARNAGLRAASGEYVVFLDADDELLPDVLSQQIAVLRDRPEAACVGGRCRLIDAAGNDLLTAIPSIAGDDLYAELLAKNFIWTPGSVVFRRSSIASIGGFRSDVSPAADYALYLRFAREGRLVVTSADVVRYRQHDANMSRDPVIMFRATLAVLARERAATPPQYADAFVRGRRAWSAFYGEQIIHLLRYELRSTRRLGTLIACGALLVKYCRPELRRHARRKIGRVLRGLPAADLEPGRFARASGRARNAGG